ncbi:DASH family cryptochrome [Marinilabilia salmonicolor]|uniref:DASH family cryptochrome n=1 Tax=Marinilabilia salmonicolor TaxID=989 RepID=UPI0002E2D36F|nr:DASH family cryptochrome [Marinilabilia salmonicolor]
MSNSPIIYWFRNDLRIHDNPALTMALSEGNPVIPIFIADNIWFETSHPELNFPRTGLFRKQFLAESLADLDKTLKKFDRTLYIFKGDTAKILKKLVAHTKSSKIVAQREIADEEATIEQRVSRDMHLELHWGSMLYQPDQIDFPVEKSPFYYTRFKNKVLSQAFTPSPMHSPAKKELQLLSKISLPPDLTKLNPDEWLISKKGTFFHGGETNALQRMEEYFNSGGAAHYSETRNQFEGTNFSSFLAPWLANGSLSPRIFYQHLQKAKKGHSENAESFNTLTEQLIWRDNFRFLFLRYGNKFFSTNGLRKPPHRMYNDYEAFEMWKTGKTGQPIIDALMHELNETGFMSNRGRMLVSFYLAKELRVNWQWGAAWFESMLIDYDVYSNYGNWAYQSGRGTDSRVNRKFNLETQTKKFDPRGSFIQKWK